MSNGVEYAVLHNDATRLITFKGRRLTSASSSLVEMEKAESNRNLQEVITQAREALGKSADRRLVPAPEDK